MFSKASFALRGLLLGALFVLSSCGLKIGERPANDSIVKLGSAETACLSGASATFFNLFNGHTSDQEISGVYNCAASSLKLFEERVRTSKPNSYRPAELKKFLEDYFLGKTKIRDALVGEVMELKKTLLGGSADELTVEDLHRARAILETLRDLSIQLRPYLPLTPTTAQNLSNTELALATQAIELSAKKIAEVLESSGQAGSTSSYKFSNLDKFLEEVERFLENDDYIHRTEILRKYIPLAIQIKTIFASADPEQIAGDDWRKLLTRAAKFYGLLLRAGQVIHSQTTLFSGSGREALMAVTRESFQALNEVISDPVDHPDGIVSFCTLYNIIDQVTSTQLYGQEQDLNQLVSTHFKDYPIMLKPYLTVEDPLDPEHKKYSDYLHYYDLNGMRFYRGTLKQFLQPLVQTLLRPDTDPGNLVKTRNGPRFAQWWNACNVVDQVDYRRFGVRAENLNRLLNTLELASEGQHFLEKTFEWAGDFRGGRSAPLESDVQPMDLMSWSHLGSDGSEVGLSDLFKVPDSTLSDTTRLAVETLRNVVQFHIPFFKSGDLQMSFGSATPLLSTDSLKDAKWGQSFFDLSIANAMHQLVRLVWHSYAADPSTIDLPTGGLSVDELQKFYYDIKEVGTSVYLFDPVVASSNQRPNSADKRFLEGNLFTYSANGDKSLSLDEGADLVSFLFSSKKLSSNMYQLVHDQCATWYDGCAASDSPSTVAQIVSFLGGSSREDLPKSCHIGPVDNYGKEKISTACFRHMAFEVYYPQIWDYHFPQLAQYYEKLPVLGDQTPDSNITYRETFSCMVEAVSRSTPMDSQWLDSSDIDQFAALYHYMEGIFVRFDRNHSGTLNQDEAYLAYPVLAQTLKDTAHKLGTDLSSDDEYRAVLSYLLANGQVPSAKDLVSAISVWFRSHIYSWDFEADRARVLQAMGVVIGRDLTVCPAAYLKKKPDPGPG